MLHPNFMKKENRDQYVRELKVQGRTVRKTSIRNQQLHPQYVADYPVQLNKEDCGFGNTIYKTLFAVLYSCSDC